MDKLLLITLLLTWQLLIAAFLVERRRWSFTILDIVTESKTPDKIESAFNVTRKREIGNVFSGYIDLKEDLTDKSFMELNIFRYVAGQGYRATAMGVPKQKMNSFMNVLYVPNIMEDLKECAPLALLTSPVTSPVKKRRVVFTDCVVQTNENWPRYMTEGVYKAEIKISGEMEWIAALILKVEHDD